MPSCGDCGKGFGFGGCSGIHSQRWEGSCQENFIYNCPNCMEVFNTKNRRRTHMNKQHTGAQCGKCNKAFYDKKRLEQHTRQKVHKEASGKSVEPKSLTGINQAARSFHDKYARPPTTLKQIHKDAEFRAFNDVTKELATKMKDGDFITKEVRVGSAYERTNIKEKSDFDVLFVNRNASLKKETPSGCPSGYVVLKKDGEIFNAEKYANKFKGHVQKIINQHSGDRTLKLVDHGPAFQIDVSERRCKIISIDVVPTVELADGKMYITKKPNTQFRQSVWRNCTSYEAREKLLTIDQGNKCHREAYRTCKAIRNNEPNLSHISSFELKSALFMTSDQKEADWGREHLGDRVKDVLSTVAANYKCGEFRDYFDPGINLIARTDEATRTNTVNRINRLVENPDKLFPIPEE